MLWCGGLEACGIVAPQPGIKPHTPCTGGQSLNHWTARKVPDCISDKTFFPQ